MIYCLLCVWVGLSHFEKKKKKSEGRADMKERGRQPLNNEYIPAFKQLLVAITTFFFLLLIRLWLLSMIFNDAVVFYPADGDIAIDFSDLELKLINITSNI